MSFPSYPAYKDSGVQWLGEVPQSWSVYSLKRTVDGCVNGLWGDEPDGENDIAVIRVADFKRSFSTVGLDKLTYRSITPKEKQSRLIKSGDLLIEKSGGGEKRLLAVSFCLRMNLRPLLQTLWGECARYRSSTASFFAMPSAIFTTGGLIILR